MAGFIKSTEPLIHLIEPVLPNKSTTAHPRLNGTSAPDVKGGTNTELRLAIDQLELSQVQFACDAPTPPTSSCIDVIEIEPVAPKTGLLDWLIAAPEIE